MSVYLLNIPRCEHILDTGFRCGSPALKGKSFCYHHNDVHAARPKIGTKGYRFRPLETKISVTLQLADIAQAAHDGAISLQLARLLLYSVQLGAPYVSKSTGYSGGVETELTPAMSAARLCRTNIPVQEIMCGTDIPVQEVLCGTDIPVQEVMCGTDIPVRHQRDDVEDVMEAGRPRPADEVPTTAPCHHERGRTSGAPFKPSIGLSGVVNDTVMEAGRPRPANEVHTCHPERGRRSEPKDPVPALSHRNPEPLSTAAVTPDHRITSSPDELRRSIFHPDPAAVRAYWTQHLTPEIMDLRLPSGDPVYTPPEWLPLTEEQLAYLRYRTGPTDRRLHTPEERENYERMTLHCTHGMVKPPHPEELVELYKQHWNRDKMWNAFDAQIKKDPNNAAKMLLEQITGKGA